MIGLLAMLASLIAGAAGGQSRRMAMNEARNRVGLAERPAEPAAPPVRQHENNYAPTPLSVLIGAMAESQHPSVVLWLFSMLTNRHDTGLETDLVYIPEQHYDKEFEEEVLPVVREQHPALEDVFRSWWNEVREYDPFFFSNSPICHDLAFGYVALNSFSDLVDAVLPEGSARLWTREEVLQVRQLYQSTAARRLILDPENIDFDHLHDMFAFMVDDAEIINAFFMNNEHDPADYTFRDADNDAQMWHQALVHGARQRQNPHDEHRRQDDGWIRQFEAIQHKLEMGAPLTRGEDDWVDENLDHDQQVDIGFMDPAEHEANRIENLGHDDEVDLGLIDPEEDEVDRPYGLIASHRGVAVVSFPDGDGIVRLANRKDVEEEGHSMGHCAGVYWPHMQNGSTALFSYRNAAGYSVATIEIALDPSDKVFPRLRQIKGFDNQSPIPNDKALERISWFVARLEAYPGSTLPDGLLCLHVFRPFYLQYYLDNAHESHVVERDRAVRRDMQTANQRVRASRIASPANYIDLLAYARDEIRTVTKLAGMHVFYPDFHDNLWRDWSHLRTDLANPGDRVEGRALDANLRDSRPDAWPVSVAHVALTACEEAPQPPGQHTTMRGLHWTAWDTSGGQQWLAEGVRSHTAPRLVDALIGAGLIVATREEYDRLHDAANDESWAQVEEWGRGCTLLYDPQVILEPNLATFVAKTKAGAP